VRAANVRRAVGEQRALNVAAGVFAQGGPVPLAGIQFLPLDKTLYLRVQSFINLTESTIPEIAYTCFLYSQQLVFSGLEQEDIRILYRYITAGFLHNLPTNPKPAEEVARAGAPRQHQGAEVRGLRQPAACATAVAREAAARGQEALPAQRAGRGPERGRQVRWAWVALFRRAQRVC